MNLKSLKVLVGPMASLLKIMAKSKNICPLSASELCYNRACGMFHERCMKLELPEVIKHSRYRLIACYPNWVVYRFVGLKTWLYEGVTLML